MTQEEKAKAYDKALEWMRKVYPTLTGADKEDAEHYFPELKESEDERIGNVIYCIVRDNKEVKRILEGNGVSVDNALAYLEKQKINTEGDFGRGYDCGYKACLNSHGAEFFEKQKEQKPAEDWSEDIIRRGIKEVGLTQYQINWLKNNVFPPKEEQKPVDLEKETRKHTDLFQADIEYPLRLTAIKFYELGKTEGIKGNLEEIPSNVDLEKAAEEYALSLSKSSMGGKEYCKQDFKAGAEWQKKQDEDGKALLYVNDHAYKKGFKDGKIEAMLNNELIWQDVKQIVNIADKEIEGLYRPFDKFPTEQSYYKEILKKYKEQKNK